MSVKRSPCEIYLKYLLVHPDKYSNEHIRTLVRAQGLDFIGMPYLQRLRITCRVPAPFYPEDSQHRPSFRFLQKERIELLFHPNKDMQAAQFVLGEPRAKEMVEAMLIARSDAAWIARNLRRLGYDIKAGAITQFKWHYFNVDIVDSSEMRALLSHRSSGDPSGDVDEQVLKTARQKVDRYDSRVLTAQAQVGPLAAIVNQVRIGVLPTKLELGRLTAAARTVAIAGALEAVMDRAPTPAREYALTAKLMTEILEQVGVAESDLQAGLSGLLLATDKTPTPHIDQLTDGEHTMDMQIIDSPQEEAFDDDEQVD